MEPLSSRLGTQQGEKVNKEYLNPKDLSKPGTYTHVVSVAGAGKLVYVSGQVSYAADGSIVGKGDIRAQSEQVFKNVTSALKAVGAGWDDVVKLNGYMVDLNADAVAAYREVRARFLKPGQFPASTLVGVTRLVQDELLLEVELVAALGNGKPAKKKR
jgi:enamine deaminase RidA (YjgF/YER057c/UK114 family)